MNLDTLRFALLVGWSSACCAACAGEAGERSTQPAVTDIDPAIADSDPALTGSDPILGTWRWSGSAPGPTALAATFNPDRTFAFVLQRAPASLPAGTPASAAPGFDPDACLPTLFVNGTYVEMPAEGGGLLSWTFTEGTANKISGCRDPSLNQPGTPLTADVVSSYIEMGPLPPTTVTFTVTSSELRLRSSDTGSAGVGRDGTPFLKAL